MVNFNPVVGGPIIKDKIWFFGGLRYQYTDSYIGGMWYDKPFGLDLEAGSRPARRTRIS